MPEVQVKTKGVWHLYIAISKLGSYEYKSSNEKFIVYEECAL